MSKIDQKENLYDLIAKATGVPREDVKKVLIAYMYTRPPQEREDVKD